MSPTRPPSTTPRPGSRRGRRPATARRPLGRARSTRAATSRSSAGTPGSRATRSSCRRRCRSARRDPLVVTLQHAYDLERRDCLFDGGVIEVIARRRRDLEDVTALGVNPGLHRRAADATGNPLAGRQALQRREPRLPGAQPVDAELRHESRGPDRALRFRIGTDAAGAAVGWLIDDIEVTGITNTPFPILVPEPSTCTARERSVTESGVLATFAAPAKSLRAFDQQVCILNDTP